MGHGIAQVTAQAGYEVVLCDIDDGAIQRGIARIDKHLARAVEKGSSSQEEADAVRARIQTTTGYWDLSECDLVIEAITEDLARKLEMWREVDGVVKADAVFATNTSSLSVVEQAASTSRRERFLGLHYFNPPQVMKLVEVVRGVTTSDDTLEVGLAFARSQNKLAVTTRDRAGFIVNRLLVPYMLDAMRAFEEGVGTIAEIDEAMKAGAGHPMGPLSLADFVGLDTVGDICDVMFDEFRERRLPSRPCCARCSRPAGWAPSRGSASTTTRARRPRPTPGLF